MLNKESAVASCAFTVPIASTANMESTVLFIFEF